MDFLIRIFRTPGVPPAALVVFLAQIGLPVPAMPALVVAVLDCGCPSERTAILAADLPARGFAPSCATFE